MLPNGADVAVNGKYYHLDQGYIDETGRRHYVHRGRSLFAGRTDVSGKPGAQNLQPDNLVWQLTDFDGEGRVVFDNEQSGLFYSSEGLNYRTPGQFTLNRSSLPTSPLDSTGAAVSTFEGNANFTDIVGTSTTSGTDRKLVLRGDEVGTSSNDAPGASARCTVDFYLFRDGFSSTSINGSSFVNMSGDTKVVATEMVLKSLGSEARSAILTEPTDFTAGQPERVDFYLRKSASDPDVAIPMNVRVWRVEQGGPFLVVQKSLSVQNTAAPSSPSASLTFTPAAGRQYFWSVFLAHPDYRGVISTVAYGPNISSTNTATIEVWNQTTSSSVISKTITVDATSAGSKLGSLVFTATADNFRYRVTRGTLGQGGFNTQPIWVDKVVRTTQSTGTWTLDALELGLGGQIYLVGHKAATDSAVWTYTPAHTATTSTISAVNTGTETMTFSTAHGLTTNDAVVFTGSLPTGLSENVQYYVIAAGLTTTDLRVSATLGGAAVNLTSSTTGGVIRNVDTWTAGAALTGATAATCYDLDHSDKYEYALMSDAKIYYSNNGATHTAYTAAITGTPVGMAIAQNRIFVLCEDSTNGVIVRTFAVDGAAVVAESNNVTVTSALNTADTTMRERMASTPSGARFFVNYSDVTAKVYEADASGASLVYREIADLGHGVKASAIAYEGGITFITGQFTAEADQTPRSALWIIDQNGVLQRTGFFRKDTPNANAPCYITPYQTDLFLSQGPYVWRYSLTTGGLFLEYELQPQDSAQARSLAVLQGRTMVLYGDDGSGTNSSEVWVTGSSGSTYRQAGVTGANQYISSDYDYGLPGFTKSLVSLQVLTETLPASTQVTMEYQTDQSGTWVLAGTHTAGASGTFIMVDGGGDDVTFNSIAVRVTPASLTGANTPTIRAVQVKALPAEAEEFFDLVLLCNDEDPAFHIDGQQGSGSDLAANLINLWRTKASTPFSDGYSTLANGVSQTYVVRVDDFRDERPSPGEGRVFVTLRVLQ